MKTRLMRGSEIPVFFVLHVIVSYVKLQWPVSVHTWIKDHACARFQIPAGACRCQRSHMTTSSAGISQFTN